MMQRSCGRYRLWQIDFKPCSGEATHDDSSAASGDDFNVRVVLHHEINKSHGHYSHADLARLCDRIHSMHLFMHEISGIRRGRFE